MMAVVQWSEDGTKPDCLPRKVMGSTLRTQLAVGHCRAGLRRRAQEEAQ